MKPKSRFANWLYKNRNKGIPNLMLWVAIGNLLVYLMTRISLKGYLIVEALCFDPTLILQGQVWRTVTFIFTYLAGSNLFLGAVSLFFYYWIGKVLEQYWGILRFNLFYFSGIVIGAVFALLLEALWVFAGVPLVSVYLTSAYVNLSLFLALATLQPDAQLRIWFILPVKMKWIAWVDIILSLVGLIMGIMDMIKYLPAGVIYLGWLVPILALANYFLFFGKAVENLLPDRLRYHHSHPKKVKQAKANPGWASNYRSSSGERAYRFKCTVCGRTDRSNPELEFRYCSSCTGYRCYCIDHINNHSHITQ